MCWPGQDLQGRKTEACGGQSRDGEVRGDSILPPSQVMMSVLSDWSEGMAFAQRLILLGVERLPLQVDLAELER